MSKVADVDSIWSRPEPGGTNPRLSRAKIAEAALAIADTEGFDAVSMRRVAQEIGVGTMSLYYYVKTKDELVALMDDAIMGEALVPSLPKDWRRALLAIARRTHDLFVRHRWALVALHDVPPGPNTMRHVEQCLEALASTTMTAKQKLTLLAIVDDFVFGHALRTPQKASAVDLSFARAQLESGAFPRLGEVHAKGKLEANEDRFERGLRALLDADV